MNRSLADCDPVVVEDQHIVRKCVVNSRRGPDALVVLLLVGGSTAVGATTVGEQREKDVASRSCVADVGAAAAVCDDAGTVRG